MIKINLVNSSNILSFHYNNLTIKKGKEKLIVDRLLKRSNNYSVNSNIRKTYLYLIEKVKKDINGFSILTAKPNELENFINDFEVKYGKNLNKKRRKDLLNVFYYESYDNWKAYELAKKINVNVCPYCNRSYTFIIGSDINKGTRFEYDHFFCKYKYPYLALSFYNLVPSCHICNSNLKGGNKFNLNDNIHPYLKGFGDDYVFSIKPENIRFIYGEPTSYNVKFVKGKNTKWSLQELNAANNNVETFKLEDLYNYHKDYINEIIQKSIVYNEDHIKELFNKYNGSLFRSEDDVRRMVLGNYISEDEYSKRPLSKLTADISRELGIIK